MMEGQHSLTCIVTLAQASLINIPGYVFRSTLILASLCDAAEKICRDFIWGSTVDAKKRHLIAWDRLCCPKDEGGLGFRNLKIFNKAHMMKLAWSMLIHQDKLWVRIMKAKYSCSLYHVPKFYHKAKSTSTWRAIVNAWADVKNNIIYVIKKWS